MDQIPSPISITTVFIDRTTESGYHLGKLKFSWNALTNRTGGRAANISRVMYPREVKIRTCDHGALDFFFISDFFFFTIVRLNGSLVFRKIKS